MQNKLTLKLAGTFLAAAAVVPISSEVNAASTASNTIYSVTIEGGTQYAQIMLDGGPYNTGRPTSCHNPAFGSNWSFDISTAKGKALLATAQAALLSGKTVSVVGSDTCNTVSGSIKIENLTSLRIFRN
jgi:hypothetical protein